MQNLAEVLRQWRYAERTTVREAAARVGLEAITYSRLERGFTVNADTLRTVLFWLLAPGASNSPEEAVELPTEQEVNMGRSG